MRPNGKLFDGSNSLFETQQLLLEGNVAGNALWLTHFTPMRLDQPFRFRITAEEEYANFSDYLISEITHEVVTVPYHITFVDVSVQCGCRSSINLAEFMWMNVYVFAFKMYARICVPFNIPTVFYINNNGAASVGWSSDSLSNVCLDEFRLLLRPFVSNCTNTYYCRYNACLRQPPSIRRLASHTVFHLTFNLSVFTLTKRTLYHQYLLQRNRTFFLSAYIFKTAKYFCARETL